MGGRAVTSTTSVCAIAHSNHSHPTPDDDDDNDDTDNEAVTTAHTAPAAPPHRRTMPAPPLSILQSLSPRVAVLSSDDVADSCAANGCAGLDELLRPWEGGTDRGGLMAGQAGRQPGRSVQIG